MLKKSKKILIISSLTQYTGPETLSNHVSSILRNNNHKVDILDVAQCTVSSLNQKLNLKCNYSIIIGVNAYLAGRLLVHIPINYLLILSGNDICVDAYDAERCKVMEMALKKAKKIVSSNVVFSRKVTMLFPFVKDKIVNISHSPRISLSLPHYTFSSLMGISHPYKIFLMPTSLKPVKDPSYLSKRFHEWSVQNPDMNLHLVLIGPKIDGNISQNMMDMCKIYKSVHYFDPIFSDLLHALMIDSEAVVNSSLSEGLGFSLLEAMALRVPIIARANERNQVLLANGRGLLYPNPEVFISQAMKLLNSSELKESLVEQAFQFIKINHTKAVEEQKYLDAMEYTSTAAPDNLDEIKIEMSSSSLFGRETPTDYMGFHEDVPRCRSLSIFRSTIDTEQLVSPNTVFEGIDKNPQSD